ncbi:MAG: chromosomal replication initiator protein DnaA [Chloroflexi bacterium]|nr:chromosomal replication initiator protein DnaA [Chloroflexota bacterium]
MNARQIWQAALGELQLQMTRADYETWLKNTAIVSHEDGTFVVAVPSPFVKEWLDNRLAVSIKRTLVSILGYTVDVKFVVQPILKDSGQGGPSLRHNAPAPEKNPAVAVSADRVAESSLSPKYTFDNYIVGNSNRLAHAASLAVARRLTQDYNPLFLYGGVGLGKTHLLHAIGHLALQQDLKVLYVSSETFTNDLINSIREQKTEAFRHKYRRIDFLLVDDIQFLAGKEGTQEEFFHTFNALHGANKQIVVSSDRPPKAILAMEDRLRSRFEWGLIADIQPPDLETRIAILRAKGESQGIPIPSEVIDYIANRVQSNIRELEGSLNRVVAYAALTNSPVTVQVAAMALNDTLVRPRKASPTKVVETVAAFYGLGVSALQGKKRDKEIVLPRQVAMYLLREETDASLVQIGEALGGRDHSTILHGCGKISASMSEDNGLRQEIMSLREKLYARPNGDN